jgi:hypothetical protein
MSDIFVGTWKLNVEKSEFDPKHVPTAGTLVFERESEGCYLMRAQGVNSAGEKVAERPQRYILDGQEHPIPDIPGLTAFSSSPDPSTLVTEGRMNGKVVGHSTSTVSADGQTLSATASGMGVNGPFKTRAVFDRVAGGVV